MRVAAGIGFPVKSLLMVRNILADRYASQAMRQIWSPEGRVLAERDFWIAVLRAQADLGLPIPQEAIDAYERVKNTIHLESIDARERKLRHDVKARIEEFCGLAGFEEIHKGMTSRDLTENVEQLQVFRSLQVVLRKAVAVLHKIVQRAQEWESLMVTGRTHYMAAQPTTLGKRLASIADETMLALERMEHLIQRYPARGLKGAIGTQLDLMTLFHGDSSKVDLLEERVLDYLGIPGRWSSVGQVYPRSLDMETVSTLVQCAAPASNFARMIRLMAGAELMSEGFSKDQVGSSAMPHKMNSRSCERINGFYNILRGYLTMVEGPAGDQWLEGDVSCSVVRRVALPDSFFAFDGLLETWLTILDEMKAFPASIDRENQFYLPFLATTTILMEAVKKGSGRESAHHAIRENAVACILELRQQGGMEKDLPARLGDDERIPLTEAEIRKILSREEKFLGRAVDQVREVAARSATWLEKFPGAEKIQAGAIL